MAERYRITVEGIVQGVGFRPFVYRLATECSLYGWVSNTSDGVVIQIEGGKDDLETFLSRLENDPPPLARITSIKSEKEKPIGYEDFTIRHSLAGADPRVLVSPDTATCPDCVRELLTPADRRYRYPFINCTNCGPRYTIIKKVPYDRPNTSMASFTMCSSCQREYDDPADRRFHAQPNACADCGPSLALVHNNGTSARLDSLAESLELLKKGKIVAIKGLGGFHLAVDALSSYAVERLREKKGREEKPLALMVRDLAAAEKLCRLDDHARKILTSTESPIALLRRRQSPEAAISPAVAPKSRYFGLMLPYTPMHHLLMEEFEFLVMTSANITEEPLCSDNQEAMGRLHGIADAWLTHDRDILLRCDDSIVRLDPVNPDSGPVVLRRARGFVPSPVFLPFETDPVLALGPELKGTVCLTRGNRAFIGQHLGDLKNLETLDFLLEVVSHLMDILQVTPAAVARDLHPDFMTTSLAEFPMGVPWPEDLPVVAVQHHHAHILSCQAEAGKTGPVLGLSLDGTGYGTDGTVWGGEILRVDGHRMERKGYLKPVWMPGGEKAIDQPWRMAVSWMVETMGETEAIQAAAEFFPSVPGNELETIVSMCSRRSHGIATSSAGRLFDAFSALTGTCIRSRYEGQAAIELEMLTDEGVTDILPYSMDEDGNGALVIDPGPAFCAAVEILRQGGSAASVGGCFHGTLAASMADAVAAVMKGEEGLEPVIPLGGGVFQNEIFCVRLAAEFEKRSLKPLFHRQVPTNDGGISLGQAVCAMHARREGEI
ncbi:MAG: carbamoyltransferase HypF [bacterium]|nr:carbamoyltransferase HypF [bacterium]